jgi:hypothetical protein
MNRYLVFVALAFALLISGVAFAQNPPAQSDESVASCNLDNGDQVAIRYQPVKAAGEKSEFGSKIPYGSVWAPKDMPMVLFTSGPLSAANHNLNAGAYTLYLIPNKNDWTLVISAQTDTKAKYDQNKDIVRVPMEVGALPNSQPQLKVILGHTGPNECSMRIYWQKQGGFATFQGKASPAGS